MNFFEHQEIARRSTRRLIVLFAIAVVVIVIAVNAAATAIYLGFVAPSVALLTSPALPTGFYFVNTLIVLGLIGGGTLFKMNALSAGGSAVANLVDAREVDMTTRDLLDRRLVNVVEEMSIAAGVPVPRVYVMDNETAINAFAAGHSINDAVIAVTRGTLTRLSRDELQGVVAHEFSHVLNGDMRLNLRLIGVLHGLLIVALAGRLLLELSGRSRGSSGGSGRSGNALAVLFFAGVALWVLGYIGVFFGRLIKAAVSRQREFLADASAVQFTRNPDGIGGALRKIGGLGEVNGLGTRIEHPQAETLSHLFLGAARPSFVRGLYATHPALEERLQRIYGRNVPFMPAPENALALSMGGLEPVAEPQRAASPIQFVPAGMAPSSRERANNNARSPLVDLVAAAATGAAGPGDVAAAVGTVAPPVDRDFALDDAQRTVVETLRHAANDATHAQLIVYALLTDKDSELRAQQCALVAEAYGAEASRDLDRYHGLIQTLPPGARQPLLDVAMPALRKLPGETRHRVLKLSQLLIAADGRVSVREFLLFTILQRRLGPDAGRAVPVRYRDLKELAPDAAMVLSLVAAVRLPGRPEHAFNAGALLLPQTELSLVAGDAIKLAEVSSALDRLNQLAPLVKPQLIKAATATAFVDNETNWRAASTLRMICATLDAPLPPQVVAAESIT
ncbi:MAG: M48 family metallopeptidase [Burkholderiaceae bacterium]